MADDADVLRIPWLSVLSDLKAQMTDGQHELKQEIIGIRTELRDAVRTIETRLTQDHAALAARVAALETRCDRHDLHDGHPALAAEVAAQDTRLGALEQEAREAKARETALAQQQEGRDRRNNLRLTLLGALLTVGIIVATVLAPLLGARP